MGSGGEENRPRMHGDDATAKFWGLGGGSVKSAAIRHAFAVLVQGSLSPRGIGESMAPARTPIVMERRQSFDGCVAEA